METYQREFLDTLERLADYVGRPADLDARFLLMEVQEEFEAIKRAWAREEPGDDDRLTVGDVAGFADGIREEFPKAAKGCEVFVSVWLTEQQEAAARN